MIFVKVKKDEFPRLGFLTRYPGFNSIDSYADNLPDNQNYITYVAFYDLHFSYWDKIKIKNTVKKMGGHGVYITYLGRDPIFSKETSDLLINCSLMGVVTFFPGLMGVHFLSPGKVIEALVVGGITAASAFFTELYIERKIRQHQRTSYILGIFGMKR
jgi:hypothetical protein